MKIPVGELIVRFMERLGVEVIFGMPGAHVLPIYDRLVDSRVKSVLVKHEQGAAFMAGGYARASGRVGACITTAGPGATNLVTGIANAWVDKQPILVITGETSTYIFGKGGLQESSGEGGTFDQAALFKGITRYHKIVERTDYLGQVLRQAAKILLAPDSGPVLLSLPYNVQKELVDEEILDGIAFAAPHGAKRRPHAADEMAQLIAAARAPVIVAGYGCIKAGAQEVVAQLAERVGIPVATSLKGKGVIDEAAALSLGCIGVTSDGGAYRYVVDHADLVIFLGAGFNERTSYLWDARLLAGKKVVQVDADAAQLEKVFKADLAIHGDIREVIDETLAAAARDGLARKTLDRLPPRGPTAASAAVSEKFRLIERFFVKLAERVPHGAMVFDDNIIFAQNYYKVGGGNRYFPNSGVSSLGHAIPAAIGARFAVAGPTFAILGDGGFQMCAMEIMTAVNYAIPLNVVLINNGTMGLIRKNQFQLYGERFIDCDFVNPDFGLLARSFGIEHFRIAAEPDLDALFDSADLRGKINLIEIILDKNAFPSYLSDR
ncbi:thiamine pyrophosphate-binding protein [Sulfurisoma sediminicola]|uniref:Acetolactate synthase-1/2/3 large subunit n=1 Tax=Sulfurisoma sediminicola TaxID=1381557 RepID=A0A497XDQ5_9PROT|nr:thiamine pyrophosphate-binding protein [Sulfurisoma sediminicola]RLJ65142.1 acetolactate synthase-1/2/3 large subunit [Sulfurisoma sediminicola]